MTRTVWLMAILIGCTSRVAPIDLRDPTIPVEARRWLADAEDEVGIARADVVDASRAVDAKKLVKRDMERRAKRVDANLVAVSDALIALEEAQLGLAEATLKSAEGRLRLAHTRLELARAETAVRYDLGTSDTAKLATEAEARKQVVAELERAAQDARAQAERASDALWSRYQEVGDQAASLWGSVFLDPPATIRRNEEN